MNITSITSKKASELEASEKKQGSFQELGVQGDVIEGLITKVSDKISIRFGDKEIPFPKESVQNAKEGDIRTYKIKEVSEQHIVLEEIKEDDKTEEAAKNKNTTEVRTSSDQQSKSEQLEQKKEKEQSEKEVQEKEQCLDKIVTMTSGEDYKEVTEDGISFEKYELERLEKVLIRVKEGRIKKEKATYDQVETKKEERTQIEKRKIENGNERIIRKLEQAGLPITKANIAKVANAMELAKGAAELSETGIKYLLRTETPPTIYNIYTAAYSGSDQKMNSLTPEEWNAICPQVENIIKQNGLAVTEESLKDAKWILEQELALDRSTINSFMNLKNIKEAALAGGESYQEELLGKIVYTLASGQDTSQTILGDPFELQSKNAVEDFSSIEEETISKAVERAEKGKEVFNLNLLREVQEEQNQNQKKEGVQEKRNQSQKNSTETQQSQENEKKQEIDIKVVTARRQLEEIRLKMTVEAGVRLASKGIDLNTAQLSEIVEELRGLEKEYYENLLKESGINPSESQADILKNTLEKTEAIRHMPSYLLADTWNSRAAITLNGLYEAGSKVKNDVSQAVFAYDTMMTEVRPDLGDSIQKAFGSVDGILKDFGLETTEANRRAVRILGYNQMDITASSIQEMKYYDSQVQHILKAMQPPVVVNMIREQLNPMEMPLQELGNKLDELKEDLGEDKTERYSKYLWKLEKEEKISKEERDSYIGIYRLLDKIERSDGSVIGSVVNAGQELNLKNLLTAVRTAKSGGIRAEIDDNFGMAEHRISNENAIDKQIAAAYGKQIVEDTLKELSPEKLYQVKNSMDIMEKPLEAVKEALEEIPEQENAYWEEQAEHIKELAEHSENEIRLLHDYNIPDSLTYIEAARELMQGNNSTYSIMNKIRKQTQTAKTETDKEQKAFVEELEQASEQMIHEMENRETANSEYEHISHCINEILNREMDNVHLTAKDMAQLKSAGTVLQLTGALARKECYEIPLLVGDSVMRMNLTLEQGRGQNGRISIMMPTEEYGEVRAELTIKEKMISGSISCDSWEGTEKLKGKQERLENELESVGLEDTTQIQYGTSILKESVPPQVWHIGGYPKKQGEDLPMSESQPDTAKLYQISKKLILYFRTTMDE